MKSSRVALLCAVGAIGGCYHHHHRHVLRAVSSPEVGKAGLLLVVDGEAWHHQAELLPPHVTALGVQIINRSRHDIVVSYADFALSDENGFRYAALNPHGTPRPKDDSPPASPPSPQRPMPSPPKHPQQAPEYDPDPGEAQRSLRPSLLAALGPLPRGTAAVPVVGHGRQDDGHRRLARRPRRRRRVIRRSRRPGRRYRGFYGRRRYYRRGRRFYVYPRYRFYYGYSPWLYGGVYPPYYDRYVLYWRDLPRDRLLSLREHALPEGVVKAGGRIAGILYFQNAADRARQLTLSWRARMPAGETVAELKILLNVGH